MSYRSSYIKEVERYFLSIVGRGIMLSSRDYDLIASWRKRGVPKEVIFRGISNGARSYRDKRGGERPLQSLVYLAPSVEDEIVKHWGDKKDKSSDPGLKKDGVIKKVVERLAGIIKTEKRERVRKQYVAARKKVMDLTRSEQGDVFREIDRIEAEFYELFYRDLTESEREGIKDRAESMISGRSRFMTARAYEESVVSVRNEILKKDYKLTGIISDD
ncbi:MAG TPA: hypothetical protein VLB01_00280 [Thermodesulfobacteriota bacterium]|nr:hypothetical protein [Thermodesulfobacteriota bacterium]